MYTAKNQLALSVVSSEDKSILDIGCGTGSNAREIKKLFPECKIVGVNFSEEELKVASSYLDECYKFDLNSCDKLALNRKFDLVIFSHVLEHLIEPKATVEQFSQSLKSSGRMILVVPNFGVWSARLKILFGKFGYENDGLFDRTHLRFFTWNTFASEVVPETLEVKKRYRNGHFPLPFLRNRLPSSWVLFLDNMAINRWPNLFCSEIGLLVSRKIN